MGEVKDQSDKGTSVWHHFVRLPDEGNDQSDKGYLGVEAKD